MTRVEAAAEARRDRLEGRSGDARDLQQPLHVDRRADGRDAAEHRLFGQHQGAARLLLRGVRPARAASSPTRRTCRCIWARWTARSRPSSRRTRAASGPATCSRSTRPTTAARTCPTSPSARRCSTSAGETILFWVASRGHHADIGGVAPGSMSPLAATIHEEGVYIDNFLLVERGRFRERELCELLDQRALAGAQSDPERQRPQGADRRQREGRRASFGAWSSTSASRRSRPIWATFRTTPRRACGG